jgi:hypothetical protein
VFDNPSTHQYRLEGFAWANPGDGLTLTWSAATLNLSSGNWQANYTGQLSAAEIADVQRAFATWSSVANVHFVQVPDATNVDIRIGIGAVSATYGAGAVGVTLSSPSDDNRATGEQIDFDQGFLANPKFDDQNVYALALHEIGHSLGLDHSINANAIMAPSNFFESASLRTQLSTDDVAGIQALFGPAGAPTPIVTGDFNTKGVLAVNSVVPGAIALPGEMQFYKLSLVANQVYTFDMRGNSAGIGTLSDPELTLVDASGRMYRHETGGSSGIDAHTDPFTAPATGTYFLEAQAVQGNDTGSFVLSATGPAPVLARAITPSTPQPGIDPLESALIDVSFYLQQNPDVLQAGLDPAQHFTQFGWKEGRNPDALFDVRFYLAHNADVAQAGIDPLLHYASFGWKEGRDPSAVFSSTGYLAANADVRLAGLDPLLHYLDYGVTEGRPLAL